MDAALLDEHEAQKILRHFYFIAVRGRGTSLLVNRFWKLGLTMSNARSMGFDTLRRRLRDEEVVDAAGHLLLRIIQVHAFFSDILCMRLDTSCSESFRYMLFF